MRTRGRFDAVEPRSRWRTSRGAWSRRQWSGARQARCRGSRVAAAADGEPARPNRSIAVDLERVADAGVADGPFAGASGRPRRTHRGAAPAVPIAARTARRPLRGAPLPTPSARRIARSIERPSAHRVLDGLSCRFVTFAGGAAPQRLRQAHRRGILQGAVQLGEAVSPRPDVSETGIAREYVSSTVNARRKCPASLPQQPRISTCFRLMWWCALMLLEPASV